MCDSGIVTNASEGELHLKITVGRMMYPIPRSLHHLVFGSNAFNLPLILIPVLPVTFHKLLTAKCWPCCFQCLESKSKIFCYGFGTMIGII